MVIQNENENAFAAELEQLKSLGFFKQSQNLKLLIKTKGNVEVVTKFLEAKKAFRDASEIDRLERKALKQELKQFRKRGHNDSEESKIDKEEAKKEKKKLKTSISKSKEEEKAEKKQFKKSAKEAEKAEKKAEKLEKKLAKFEAKNLKKEKKFKSFDNEDKEKARAQKRVEKEARKTQLESFTLPATVTTVFLDGNNMLFVVKELRSRVLKRNMKEAEEMLETMAKSWLDANPQLKNVTLIFDDTKTSKFSEKFNVCSAKPQFPTSDHALLHWCQNAGTPEKPSIAVFTSDRALGDDLVKAGVNVFKSKAWFHVVSKSLTVSDDENNSTTVAMEGEKKPVHDLDQWATEWLAKHFEKMNV